MTNPHSELRETAAGHRPQPVLLLRHAKSAIRRIPLRKARLAIGRTDESDIRLQEGNGASRNHAQILVVDGEVVIEDLGSRNGTFVNRKLLRGSRHATLNFGDVIAIGKYQLKLIDEAPEAQVDTSRNVHRLLQAWPAVALPHHDGRCALCHAPHTESSDGDSEEAGADDDTACRDASNFAPPIEPQEIATDEESTVAATADATETIESVTSTEPWSSHRSQFERRLVRRPKLSPRRKVAHRAVGPAHRLRSRGGLDHVRRTR